MKGIKLIATDIDGTLTIDRMTTALHMDAIKYMRKLEENGIAIVLVSSNALPVVVGLKKYIGLRSPCIGETGAFVYSDSWGLIELSRLSARKALLDVETRFSKYIVSSWQNKFRYHDFAIKIRKEYKDRSLEIYDAIKHYVLKNYDYIKIGYSRYAIHLTPIDVDKGKALKYVLERLGIDEEEAVAIGDSFMDSDLFRVVGMGVAVSNADRELKEIANIVLNKPSGEGFVELAKMVLGE